MQANFSAAYDCYSLKTISDFIIKHIKMLRQANCTCDKKPLPAIADRGPWLIQFIQLSKLTFTFTLRL